MNLKKHEFLVKKLRRKLQACQSYLERQQDENFAGILQFVLNQEVRYHAKPDEENLTEMRQKLCKKRKSE
jgi:secreted Zn-dependent insulinase-like peptidase